MDPLIAIRLVHYGAAMLLAGGGVFRQALAPAALRARLAAPRAERWLALLVLISACSGSRARPRISAMAGATR